MNIIAEIRKDLARARNDPHYHFTLDTNILIVLAENAKSLLQELLNCSAFILTSFNKEEIDAMDANMGTIAHATKRALASFMADAVRKGKYQQIDPGRIQRELQAYVPLLPRRLVHDVMIYLDDSFVKELIREYEYLSQAMRRKIGVDVALRKAAAFFQQQKADLNNRFLRRFLFLCAELNIDNMKINNDKYFALCRECKDQVLAEIAKAITRTRNPADIINQLKQLAVQDGRDDVRFAAQTLYHGATGRTTDPATLILLEIHQAKKVA